MIYAFVCFSGVVFSLLCSVIFFREKNIIEAVVLGTVMWFFSHIFASMVLFLLDEYTIFRAGAGAALISAALFTVELSAGLKRKREEKHLFENDLSLKEMLIPIIVSVLALPFVVSKNDFFGMGQDQGVYQTQAIYFLNGDTKRQKDLEEYHELESDEERLSFEKALKEKAIGYDIPPDDYPDTSYDRSIGPSSGILHGIPTYTALLAMCGKLFGLSHMQDFETVLYICLIFIVYFICGHLKLKKVTSACACAITAFSPEMIWVSKSALTEMLLSLILAVFLYFITDEDEPKNKLLSVIPVVIFGCYHVSFYTVLPLFVMVYAGLYVFTREKKYAVIMPSIIVFYIASFFMMKHIQPVYVFKNYDPLYTGGINIYNITKIVTVISAAAFIAVIIFSLTVKKKTPNDFSASKYIHNTANSKKFMILLRAMLILPCIFMIPGMIIDTFVEGWREACHNSLLGFAVNSGMLFFPIGLIFAVRNVKYFAENTSRMVLFLMFFYCVLMYSLLLRPRIQYYYYYGRYLTPFITIAVIFSASALSDHKRKLIIPLTAVGLLYVSGYDVNLMFNKDDSTFEWKIMEDIAGYVSKEDCLVISNDYSKRLWLALKSMTGAKVIPQDIDDSDQLDRLAERYRRVNILTKEDLNSSDFSPIYLNKNHISNDELTDSGFIVPFPLKFFSQVEDVKLYSYDKRRYVYTSFGDHAKMHGFTELINDYCWTNDENANIRCALPSDNYGITLEFGLEMPLDEKTFDNYEITLLLNDKEIGTRTVTAGSSIKELHFSVNKDTVNDGENILYIKSRLRKAKMLGFEHYKELPLVFDGYGYFYNNPFLDEKIGIPVRALRFEPVS